MGLAPQLIALDCDGKAHNSCSGDCMRNAVDGDGKARTLMVCISSGDCMPPLT